MRWLISSLTAGALLLTPLASHKPRANPFGGPTRILSLGGLTMRVPASWPPGLVTLSDTNVSTTQADGNLEPLVPRSPGLTAAQDNRSPFFSETEQTEDGILLVSIQDLTAAGRFYSVTFNLIPTQRRLAHAILNSLRIPPPATATQYVRLLRRRALAPLILASADHGRDQWLLHGGQGATEMETFYLYRSTDGGRQWHLINNTYEQPPCFPGTAGSPAILFWNAQDGLIAESSFGGHHVDVYRTHDAGQHWTRTVLSTHRIRVTSFNQPILTHTQKGRLTLDAPAAIKGAPFRAFSVNGGVRWHAIQN